MPHPERSVSDRELSPLAEILTRQFINRWDMYPKQLDAGTYITIHEPLHIGLLFAHLRGEITLGTYLLNPASQGQFLVLDADGPDTWLHLLCIVRALAPEGVESYLEQSRRGGHLWLFFARKYSGRDIRRFGQGVLGVYGIKGIELYPKQDELDDGPGSVIRLPLGVHRLTNQRYGFVTSEGQPVAPTLREQLKLFHRPCTIPEGVFNRFQAYVVAREEIGRSQDTTVTQKGISILAQEGLVSERIKAVISVHEFVGQFVELSQQGRGLYPFHDDHRPSFGVNDKKNYWHCFTCKTGGSIIDFWMKYQGCNFKTAVTELTAMLLD